MNIRREWLCSGLMKRLLVVILLSLFSIQLYSQDWLRFYGQDQNAYAWVVTEQYDRGFVFGASLDNQLYGWLFKTDVNGYMLWDKTFGNGNYYMSIRDVEQTADGGFILCGSTRKYSASMDAYLMKLNACAEVEWCRVLITSGNYELGPRVKPTPEGDYVLLGAYFETNPASNISLFKFNGNGDLIWHQFYPMDSIYYEDQPKDLIVDHDGYLILNGRYYPDSGTTGPAIIRHHFLKTDTAGNKIWDLVYGANSNFYGNPWAVTKSNNGDYYEVGYRLDFPVGISPSCLIKVKHDGTPSYNAMISGEESGGLGSIDFLFDSLLVMMGAWYENSIKHDGFIKTDTLGNLIQLKDVYQGSNSYYYATKTIDNKFIALNNDATGANWKIFAIKVKSDLEYDTIYTQTFTYDSMCPQTIVSDTVDPMCDNVYVSIEEPFRDPEITRLKIFPSPADDIVTIEMPEYLMAHDTSGAVPIVTVYHQWGTASLEVYDLSGKQVFRKEVAKAEKEFRLDVSNWDRGIYVFRLLYNNRTVAAEKLIIK